jgi:APA family basic amino acid/polyamine antiporter
VLIGFDAISTTGEEVLNPKNSIPKSIMLTLVICTVLYTTTAVVLTLMVPYYQVNVNAPFVFAFEYVNIRWAKYIVSTGAIISLTTWL